MALNKHKPPSETPGGSEQSQYRAHHAVPVPSDLGSQRILLQSVQHKHPVLNRVILKHWVKLFLRFKKLRDSLGAVFSQITLSPSFSGELNERNAIIKSLTKRLKLLESQHNDSKITLENTQQKFKELTQKVSDSSVHCQALEVGIE